MDDVFCALCGVCFDVYTELYDDRVQEKDVSWTSYYQALRRVTHLISDTKDSKRFSWHISGVGQIDGSLGWRGHLLAPGHDVRTEEKDIQSEHGSYPPPAPAPDNVVPYKPRNENSEVVYPVHPACWHIFCQQHALLALNNPSTPDLDQVGAIFTSQEVEEEGRGLKVDWSVDYAGAENFWGDGWSWTEDIETSEVKEMLDQNPDLDFIVFDPEHKSLSRKLLQHPPGHAANLKLDNSLPFCPQDIFSRLPLEILNIIFGLLPTPSVRAVRLTSKLLASVPLENAFWRSRFDYPHELCHIPLSELASSHETHTLVDWKALGERLLSPLNAQEKGWRNRKRIIELTKRLVQRILSKDVTDNDARQQALQKPLTCLSSFSCSDQQAFSQERIHFDILRPASLGFCFQSRKSSPTIVGIVYGAHTGLSHLGKFDTNNTRYVTLAIGECVTGFIVGIAAEGLVGIKIIIASHDSQGMLREELVGSFEENVALGRLVPRAGPTAVGLQAGLSKNGHIISIGLIENTQVSTEAVREFEGFNLLSQLWYPQLPPISLDATPAAGLSVDGNFAYMQPSIFSTEFGVSSHIWSINCFVSPRLLGVDGFQCNFDDRGSAPAELPSQGRDVPFMIDGASGEMLCGMDVLWSHRTKHVGIMLWTNRGRRGIFATADILDDVEIHRLRAPPGSFAVGFYGEVAPHTVTVGAYRRLGLLLAPDYQLLDRSLLLEIGDTRTFDDYMNVWTEGNNPPLEYRVGKTIGHQPSCGFINYVDFNSPIRRITACLGSHKGRRGSKSSDIVGLKFDFTNQTSTVLGRCTSLGPVIDVDDNDGIAEVHIAFRKDDKADVIDEIIFHTQQGLYIGFRAGNIVNQRGELKPTSLFSSNDMSLVGMTWAFDFGFSPRGDHGIQPLYKITSEKVPAPKVGAMDSSLPWIDPPPADLQLRPAPSRGVISSSLASTLIEVDNPEDFSDLDIVAIQVFFNSFLQGIKIEYRDGKARSVGKLIGASDTIQLDQEQIFAVAIRERRQQIIRSQLSLGDILCIEGVQFGLVKWRHNRAKVRYSPWFGSPAPFGPFINNQRGLWDPLSGGSANWSECFPFYTNRIFIQPGTSFAGFFAESTKTHVCGLGVLVGTHQPLPTDALSLKSSATFANQKITQSSTHEQDSLAWLGAPPRETYHLSDIVGRKKGTYRMWCPIRGKINKIVIYRHEHWDTMHIVGLELFGFNGHEDTNELLGFRTLWMEHAMVLELEDDEHILGLSSLNIEKKDGIAALGEVQIITTHQTVASDKEDKQHCAANPADLVGFYCFIDEFIQGIGLILDSHYHGEAVA